MPCVGAGRDEQHRLRRGNHPTSEPSSATSTSPPRTTRAARQEHAELAAQRIGGVKAAFLAHVPVEFDGGGAFEQHRGQAGALGHEFGDLKHQLD